MKFKDGSFYAVEKVSPTRSKSVEGYLLCKNVPISRVGTFEYKDYEAGIPGVNGKVMLTRDAEELFSEDTINSFEMKPVTIGHGRFVDPKNWKRVSVGVVKNVRRGKGDESSFLLADLLLTDAKGIELVESGQLEEVSCGYDANAISDGPGVGHQVGIVGNHVALVKNARCGEQCKFKDGSMTANIKTLLRRMFKDGDEDGFNEKLDQVNIEEIKDSEPTDNPDPATDPAPDPSEERMLALEKRIEALEKLLEQKQQTTDDDGTDDADNTDDVDVLDDEEAEKVFADADNLCPGMKRPAADSKDGHYTRDIINRTMRNAIKQGGVTMFGDSADMDGKVLKTAFTAAVALKKQENNPKPQKYEDSKDEVRKSAQELMSQFWK